MDLFYLNGEKKGESCPLTPPGISIGREVDNDLQLLINRVSRYHAMISFDGTSWFIEDLGSTNGTFVGKNKITGKVKLSPGDEITVGEQLFRFGTAEAPKAVFNVRKAAAKTSAVDNSFLNEHPSDLASQIRKSRHSIFSGNPKQSGNGQPKTKKSRLGNLIFTLIVITLPLVCISGYMMIEENNRQKEKQSRVAPQKMPFFIYYEKRITSPDNVFRFEAKFEENMAIFTVDDLKYGRHFVVKKNNLNPAEVERLKESIRKTEFMKIENKEVNSPTGPEDKFRRLVIALDGAFNNVSVHNTYATTSFEDIETAISDLARLFNMRTGTLTAEEMRMEAKEFFDRAQDLFANYQAAPKNIRESIVYYKNAKSYYEQFEPKPKEWDICRKQLEKAVNIYKAMYKDLHFNIQKYNKLARPKEASQECGKMLELLDPDSKDYQKYRNYKIEFDRRLKVKKK